jgi:2-methylcitrate dehydratase PrpD
MGSGSVDSASSTGIWSDTDGGLTLELSRFIAELGFSDIPEAVTHQAKRCLIDWLGVTLAGSADPSVDTLCGVADDLGAHGDSTVLGRKRGATLLFAVLINGYMAHVLDYDDTYNPARTTVHGSAPVWPVVAALSEESAIDGPRAVTAFVAGFETAVRVARAAGPSHYEAGWHVTGTTGHFGAASAAANLMSLDFQAVANALGAAGTQAAGLKGVYGSMGKALHPGKAAMDGLLGALLARRGFTASTSILEDKRGFLQVFSPTPDPEYVVKDLGIEWHLLDDGFKPYACGSLTHPTIEAIITLRDRNRIIPSQIESIEARVNSYVSWVTAKPRPKTGLEGKFSIFHCAAVAAIDGAARLQQFADARVNAPEIVRMRERVSVVVDDALAKDAASVCILLTDGRRLTATVTHNKGTPEAPMTDDEIEAKFLHLATPHIGSERARMVADKCWRLHESHDTGELARLCRGEA